MSLELFSDNEIRTTYRRLLGLEGPVAPDFAAKAISHFDSKFNSVPSQSVAALAQNRLIVSMLNFRQNDWELGIAALEEAVSLDVQLQRTLSGEASRELSDCMLRDLRSYHDDPYDCNLLYWQGRLQATLGRFALALQAFTTATRSDPTDVRCSLASASIYQKLGQADQALQILQKAYETHGESASVCAEIGLFYFSQNATAQALRFLEKASSIEPSNPNYLATLGDIYLKQGRHEQALSKFQKTLSLRPQNSQALVGMAECCRELYRFEEALSYYQRAIQANPRDVKALGSHGSLCVQLGGLDLGIESLTKAVELNPNDVDICSGLAKAYQQKGDLATASRYYGRTVQLNPRDYFASYNLGLIYRSQGHTEKAAEAFRFAAELRPNDSQYQYQLARSLLDLGQSKQAFEAARRASSLNPHNKEIQLAFARASLSIGMADQALQSAQVALQLDPSNVEGLLYQAQAQLELDDAEQAEQSYLQALKLFPSHSHGLRGLGRVYLKQNQSQKALECLQQSLEADPEDGGALNDLGLIYDNLGQLERVMDSVQAVLRKRQNEAKLAGSFLNNWLAFLKTKQAYELGASLLETFIDRFPNQATVREQQSLWHTAFAEQFFANQDEEKARNSLHRLLKSQPDNAAAKELLERPLKPAEPAEPEVAESAEKPAATAGDFSDFDLTAPLEPQAREEKPAPASNPAPVYYSSQLGDDLGPPPAESLGSTLDWDDSAWQTEGGVEYESQLYPYSQTPGSSSSGEPAASAVKSTEFLDSREQPATNSPTSPAPTSPLTTGQSVPTAAPESAREASAAPRAAAVEGTAELDLEPKSFFSDLPRIASPERDVNALHHLVCEFAGRLAELGWLREAAILISDPELCNVEEEGHQARLNQVILSLAERYAQAREDKARRRLLEFAGMWQEETPSSKPPAQTPKQEVVESAAEPVTNPSVVKEYIVTGQEDVATLTALIAQHPRNKDVRVRLYHAYADDMAGLVKLFRDLVQENPDEPYHVLNLGRAFAHSGSDSMAILQLRKYTKLESTSEGFWELGDTYDRMDKKELAQQAKARAEELKAEGY